ncbi:MAG: universal stress protein [Chitinophagaceae bacterium]|nr:universal stress protein [Chitinophagaceae bacterium]
MKRIIVPTDFSDTAKNAARYAVQLAASIPNASIILYNVTDKIAVGSDGSPLTEDKNDRFIILQAALSNLRTDLSELSTAPVELVVEEGSSLTDNLERYVRHHGIDLIVMGITGATRLEQIFMGSNALNVVNLGVCPVIIVPPDATYKPVNRVLFACDFKDVAGSIPLAPIKSVLNSFKPTLLVVNVDTDHYVELTEEFKAQRALLENMLQEFSPEFYFIRMYDFQDSISSFAADRGVDLILTVPKKHYFLTGLFKTSHTKKLAYHSHVPILAVHE